MDKSNDAYRAVKDGNLNSNTTPIEDSNLPIEDHPWEPFTPPGARVLVMGTFPPAAKRWSMDFYYPNPINDFWRIIGLIYYNDPNALWLPDKKAFDLDAIKALLTEKGIAMNDTVRRARRLRGNASDKFLDVIQPVPLAQLLERMPHCQAIATTGQKAAEIVAEITSTPVPKMGECINTVYNNRSLSIWRLPSTSRAYPMKLSAKAAFYSKFLIDSLYPPIEQNRSYFN